MTDARPVSARRRPARAPRLLATLAIAGAAFAVVLPAPAARAAAGVPAAAAPDTKALIERARQRIERKDWPMAVDDLNGVLKREPGNADAHNLLAYALRNLGDVERARTHYLEALRIDPTHRSAHEYLGELYAKTGRIDEARRLLASLERLCGNTSCEEYRDLARAIADAGK